MTHPQKNDRNGREDQREDCPEPTHPSGRKQTTQMEAGARMREEGPATPTSILQQTRRHVHFGRFLKLLSALYHQRRYCFLVAVHIVCSVVIWGKSLIRRGSIAQVEHSSHASFSSLILVTITGTSVNAPSSSSNPSFNIQHITD